MDNPGTFEEAARMKKRINWTSLSVEELEFIHENANQVQKRLIGASVIDDATDEGRAMLVHFSEYIQTYADIIDDAPKLSTLKETAVELVIQ